jgi:hypothetical protein
MMKWYYRYFILQKKPFSNRGENKVRKAKNEKRERDTNENWVLRHMKIEREIPCIRKHKIMHEIVEIKFRNEKYEPYVSE